MQFSPEVWVSCMKRAEVGSPGTQEQLLFNIDEQLDLPGLLTYHSDEPHRNTNNKVLHLPPLQEKRTYVQARLRDIQEYFGVNCQEALRYHSGGYSGCPLEMLKLSFIVNFLHLPTCARRTYH